VFRSIDHQEYSTAIGAQLARASEQRGPGELGALLRSNGTWRVGNSN
jgi:2-oxoglutarate ferredoxin oxidoreductase subunit beta